MKNVTVNLIAIALVLCLCFGVSYLATRWLIMLLIFFTLMVIYNQVRIIIELKKKKRNFKHAAIGFATLTFQVQKANEIQLMENHLKQTEEDERANEGPVAE